MNDAEKQIHKEEIMRGIAASLEDVIKENIGENMGFIFVLFEFGKLGFTNYISNAERKDVIKALREAADILEKIKFIPAATHGTVQ